MDNVKFAQFLRAAYIAYSQGYKNLDYVLTTFVRSSTEPVPEYWLWVADKILADQKEMEAADADSKPA